MLMNKPIKQAERYETPAMKEFNIRVQHCIATSPSGNDPEGLSEENGVW